MQSARSASVALVLVLAVAGFPGLVTAAQEKANPLGKVIELLDSLAAKITKEGEEELKAYNAYFEWCDDVTRNKQFEIKTAMALKEKLEATISKAAGDIEAGATQIEELAAAIASGESDLKNATLIREKETADFTASEAELVDSIDTLDRAIRILSAEMQKNPAALAQVDTTRMASIV